MAPTQGALEPHLGPEAIRGLPVRSLPPFLLSSFPVPRASAAPVTDPRQGWPAPGLSCSGASGPAVAGEAMSVLGTNSCRSGSSPHPRAGVPPTAQPSLPRASPRGLGAPCPHLLSFGRVPEPGFWVVRLVTAEARPLVDSLWARSAWWSLQPMPKGPLPPATLA